MSLGWVIFGSIMQCILAFVFFLFAGLSASGLVNKGDVSEFHLNLVTKLIFLLPILCLFAAGLVIYKYSSGGSPYNYWWYLLPWVGMTMYVIYGSSL